MPDHLTFEGDFRKKYPADWKKYSCKEMPGEKIPKLRKIFFIAYNARKKSYTVVCQEKSAITRGLENCFVFRLTFCFLSKEGE